MNNQPIEKRTEDGLLSIHSIFHTIQGEGPFCGTPAVFIRLAGCNLQCPGCDTDYTSKRTTMAADDVLEAVQAFTKSGLVVITGGEPFRQRIRRLINLLVGRGYYVQVETNGTLPPPDGVPWSVATPLRVDAYLVCSPKTGKMNEDILAVACALKYVISRDSVAEDDGLPLLALGHTASPRVARPPSWWTRPVYLQPMDSKDEGENRANLDAAIGSCMKHDYILQIQLHKLIGME